MPFALIATPGTADANSYADVDDANAYHESHLYADDWHVATNERKAQALIWATRLLDSHMDWCGRVASSDQALGWPRRWATDRQGRLIASDVVPLALVHATAELARTLLTADPTSGSSGALKSLAVGPVKLEYADGATFSRDAIPSSVTGLLLGLGTFRSGTGGAITMRRA